MSRWIGEVKGGKFKCLYCQKKYGEKKKAEKCIEDHDIKLVALSLQDINKLNMILRHGNKKALIEANSLRTQIAKYLKQAMYK